MNKLDATVLAEAVTELCDMMNKLLARVEDLEIAVKILQSKERGSH